MAERAVTAHTDVCNHFERTPSIDGEAKQSAEIGTAAIDTQTCTLQATLKVNCELPSARSADSNAWHECRNAWMSRTAAGRAGWTTSTRSAAEARTNPSTSRRRSATNELIGRGKRTAALGQGPQGAELLGRRQSGQSSCRSFRRCKSKDSTDPTNHDTETRTKPRLLVDADRRPE